MAEIEGMKPFTLEEHKKFMEALDHQEGDVMGKEWEQIASHIGGKRTSQEVKLHAYDYFTRLTRHCHSTPTDECKWSAQEDFTFEQGLAAFEEGDEDRWEKMAAMLPGKSADDVRARYAKLILDLARIENGEEVVLTYEGTSRSTATTGPESGDGAAREIEGATTSGLEDREVSTVPPPDDATISTLADDTAKNEEKGVEGAEACSVASLGGTEKEACSEAEGLDAESDMNVSVIERSEGDEMHKDESESLMHKDIIYDQVQADEHLNFDDQVQAE